MLGIREDRVDQHAAVRIDQPLDLEVRLVVGLDVVEQRHVVDVLADLAVHLEVRGRAVVHPERGDDVVLAEGRQARLPDFEPEQDLEHDGDVDDVSHEAAEDTGRACVHVGEPFYKHYRQPDRRNHRG